VSGLSVPLAAALVHFVWQGALIALVAKLALDRVTAAKSRHAIAGLSMIAMAIAPLSTFAFLALREAAGALPAAMPLSLAPHRASWVPAVISFVWAFGVAIAAVRIGSGAIVARRLARECEPLDGAWLDRARAIAKALGIEKPVKVASSLLVASPSALGVLRPVVLVPASFLVELPVESLEALIAHELAHVARHDALITLVQAAIEALLFYHPAVHWISGQLAEAREACCDDAAAVATSSPLSLARALAAAEMLRADRPRLVLSSQGGDLVNRVRRLVVPSRPRAPGWALPLVAAAGLFAAGAIPCLACVASPSDEDGTAAARSAASAVGIAWLPQSVKRWSPEIEKAARAYDVDPELLAIVTMVESNGDAKAVSPAGAVGLVQVMPKTAAKIAAARGEAAGDLRDPTTNLALGASYLAEQLHAFGTVELAAAAYNAGPDAVSAWLDGRADLSEETLHYKAKIAKLWQARRGAERP
jgi:soluble lytic murein transglycosylase-like protein